MKNKDLIERIENMKLSEIRNRLLEIQSKLKSNDSTVIDELIPLTEEAKLLKEKADALIGNMENYLAEKE